jgi:biopolymer transport protein TolR
MSRQRRSRQPMSEINVVPYIDVMLVLLIIFMVTAPLLTTGVQVDLPEASAEPIPPESEEPLIVSVSAKGEYFLDVGENKEQPLDGTTMIERVTTVLRNNPKTPILVRGDRAVEYGRVVEAMVLLQQAGVKDVGLVTNPPES